MYILLAIISVFLFAIGFFVLPWVILDGGLRFSPDPPSPGITYGEFPFHLEYEINGEYRIIEDVLICEYAGVGRNEAVGKDNKWKEHLKSGSERVVLLDLGDNQVIYYPVGSAEYYMGDLPANVTRDPCFPNAAHYTKFENGSRDRLISAEELLTDYGISLIGWKQTDPITQEWATSAR